MALLMDDAHLQGRALLLGAPLFLEPSADRHALLVLAAPDDPELDGPLGELLDDAGKRGLLSELAGGDPGRVAFPSASSSRPRSRRGFW